MLSILDHASAHSQSCGAGKSVLNKMADMYWASLSKQLNRFGLIPPHTPTPSHRRSIGLRYDDVIVETPELYEALRRIRPEEAEGRAMRYRRCFSDAVVLCDAESVRCSAVDLSFKKQYLPEEVQAKLKVKQPP